MSADFTTAETYTPRELTAAEREVKAHELAAERSEKRGRHDVAEDHRLAAEILRKDIPPVGTPRVESYEERYARWAKVGGDPIHSIDKEQSNAQ
jgi:hypothetical protein